MESNTYMVAGQTFELQHYGVKGMKWGVRKKYYNPDGSLNDRGVEKYAKKGYARDVARSSKTVAGKALAAYTGSHDVRASAKYASSSKEQNQARAEKYLAEKQRIKGEKKKFRDEVKYYKKHGMNVDYDINEDLGTVTVTGYRDSHGNKIKGAYANQIMARGNAEKTLAVYAGTTAFVLGSAVVSAMLSTR